MGNEGGETFLVFLDFIFLIPDNKSDGVGNEGGETFNFFFFSAFIPFRRSIADGPLNGPESMNFTLFSVSFKSSVFLFFILCNVARISSNEGGL